MNGFAYLAQAGLIVLLLPAVILPWEGRKVPDLLYLAIAACGLGYTASAQGPTAAVMTLLTGIVCLTVLTILTTVIRNKYQILLLTGGHIKLLVSGAMWMNLSDAAAMVTIALLFLILIAILQNLKSVARRPDFSAIAAITIIAVNLHQSLPGV